MAKQLDLPLLVDGSGLNIVAKNPKVVKVHCLKMLCNHFTEAILELLHYCFKHALCVSADVNFSNLGQEAEHTRLLRLFLSAFDVLSSCRLQTPWIS